MIDGRLDPRSQALFRIALGMVILTHAIRLTRDFAAFFQATGVLPPHSPLLQMQAITPFLHLLVSEVLPLLACALIAGFFTRIATLGCFISLIVIQNANWQILQGGDSLLVLLLFWSLFLPLGQTWSIDVRRQSGSAFALPWTSSLAPWAFTLQICFVYWFAALLKSDPLWTQNDNAMFYALNLEHFTTPFGLYLRQFPDFLRTLTHWSLCLEFMGPMLLLVPVHRAIFRLTAVILFLGFHLVGMELLFRISLFPWICAVAWLIFIPNFVWDWLLRKKSLSLRHEVTKSREADDNEKTVPAVPRNRLLDGACAALIVLSLMDVLAWNIASLQDNSRLWMYRHDFLGKALHLQQRWNMYAPFPRSEHGWLIVSADLASGGQIDLFTGKPISWEKPDDIGVYLGDDLWRRYLSNLFDYKDPEALQIYADYLIRNWNKIHGSGGKVQAVTIYYMKQVTMPDLTVTSPEKKALYSHVY